MQITNTLHWLQGLKINIIETILLEILSKIKYSINLMNPVGFVIVKYKD